MPHRHAGLGSQAARATATRTGSKVRPRVSRVARTRSPRLRGGVTSPGHRSQIVAFTRHFARVIMCRVMESPGPRKLSNRASVPTIHSLHLACNTESLRTQHIITPDIRFITEPDDTCVFSIYVLSNGRGFVSSVILCFSNMNTFNITKHKTSFIKLI